MHTLKKPAHFTVFISTSLLVPCVSALTGKNNWNSFFFKCDQTKLSIKFPVYYFYATVNMLDRCLSSNCKPGEILPKVRLWLLPYTSKS